MDCLTYIRNTKAHIKNLKKLSNMKNVILSIICAATVILAPSCHKISGDGPTITQTYNLTGFNGVNAGIDGDVYFTQSNEYKVEIVGQSNIISHVQTYIENGVLQMHFEPLANIGRHTRLTAYVSAPAAYNLGVNGSGTLKVLQPLISSDLSLKVNGSGDLYVSQLNGSNLSANISGSGNISVGSGNVRSENLQISGSGTIDLLNIYTKNCTTHTSGSGTTKVNVSDYLDATISGSGDVYYLGNPIIHTNISGSGKVVHY